MEPWIETCCRTVLEGGSIRYEEGLRLIGADDLDGLLAAAGRITRHFRPRVFDSCSIINARAGRCGEDCHWCAQSAHFKTGAAEGGLVSEARCVAEAVHNHRGGIGRFSLVTSGRRVSGAEMDRVCAINRAVTEATRDGAHPEGIFLCASLGLLSREDLEKLHASGVRRYHCNLETAPSYFPSLCSTHTPDDKRKTIAMARELGFEICCGGIIGMGETPAQRVEFAFALKEMDPVSVPINILSPIPGTPLQDEPLISTEDILRCIALFRFVMPRSCLRFAGGRARLSREDQLRCLRAGIDGGIVGDLLTTLGSTVEQDRAMVREAGLDF